ncbi:MAG: response regulator transcription factor [Ornithinimicrobium sp.]
MSLDGAGISDSGAAQLRISVVLVDDDALVRTGLSMILGGASGIEIVGEAVDGREALDVVRRLKPDVVLMDIRMPRMDGLEATAVLLKAPNPPKVIVLTTFDTDDLVVSALRLGASGFLLKSTRPERLVEAIKGVAAGEPMLSPSVVAQLISRVTEKAGDGSGARDAALRRISELTDREREVAVAIGGGHSNAEVAKNLYMGLPTVKAHVSRILTKWDLDNRTQIAITVHDAGLT